MKGPPEKLKHRPSTTVRSPRALFTRRLPHFLDPISRLGEHPIKIVEPYVKKGDWVADLGCGWGYYSFVLANLVGPDGKVIAIDLDETCIRSIQKRIVNKGIHNLKTRAASAADPGFIADRSIDLVFANGLLCSMASGRQMAVSEIKRILKPTGKAFISVGAPSPLSFLDDTEWEEILRGFTIEDSAANPRIWTIVSTRPKAS